MGSGGMIVMDEDDCMPAVAKFYLEFTAEESCGKCTPCRVGTKRLLEILEKIVSGRGTPKDLETLKELSEVIKDTALCGLGQTASNPVLSTLKVFEEEYIAHVRDHKCPAKQCSALLQYRITEKCVGCTACSRVCPVGAISEADGKYVIDADACIDCGACAGTCPVAAPVAE